MTAAHHSQILLVSEKTKQYLILDRMKDGLLRVSLMQPPKSLNVFPKTKNEAWKKIRSYSLEAKSTPTRIVDFSQRLVMKEIIEAKFIKQNGKMELIEAKNFNIKLTEGYVIGAFRNSKFYAARINQSLEMMSKLTERVISFYPGLNFRTEGSLDTISIKSDEVRYFGMNPPVLEENIGLKIKSAQLRLVVIHDNNVPGCTYLRWLAYATILEPPITTLGIGWTMSAAKPGQPKLIAKLRY